MIEKDRLINDLIDSLVEGVLTAEEAIIRAFDAGYDQGHTDSEDLAKLEHDLRESDVWIR